MTHITASFTQEEYTKRFTPRLSKKFKKKIDGNGMTDINDEDYSLFPVGRRDVLLLNGVINTFQSQVFNRYQIRATCKLITSISFLLVPWVISFTNCTFLPENNSPTEFTVAGTTVL